MICPNCLSKDSVHYEQNKNLYRCTSCREEVPKYYVKLINESVKELILGAVGYTGHGKTVYMTVLFKMLKRITSVWKKGYYNAVNRESLKKVYADIKDLERGQLPEATPQIFPKPVIIEMAQIPRYDRKCLILFDTSGEVFKDPDKISDKGKFVLKSPVALFLVSLSNLILGYKTEWPEQLDQLLNAYILGAAAMNTDLKKQSLVVAFSKGDELIPYLDKDIVEYLQTGTIDRYGQDPEEYLQGMEETSDRLEEWLIKKKCISFVRCAEDKFKMAEFCIFSSLGAAPLGKRLASRLEDRDPKRVLDPLLWALELGTNRKKKRKKGAKRNIISQIFKPKNGKNRQKGIKYHQSFGDKRGKKPWKITRFSSLSMQTWRKKTLHGA